MDDLFNIFLNTVVDQYDLRINNLRQGTQGNFHTEMNDWIDLIMEDEDSHFQLNQNVINNIHSLRRYYENHIIRTSNEINEQRETDNVFRQGTFTFNDGVGYGRGRGVLDNDISLTFLNIINNFAIDDLLDYALNEQEFEDVKVTLSQEEFNNLEKINVTLENKELYDDKCNICLDDMDIGSSLIKLKCKHYFHCDCISKWLTEQSTKCPVCRTSCKDDL
jgi:hypothetical protein